MATGTGAAGSSKNTDVSLKSWKLLDRDNGSDMDDDKDLSDFTEAGYKLQDQMLPPSLTSEQLQHMSSLKKAKTLQQLLDEQIKNLSTNKSLKEILDRTVSDVIPCPVEHRVHFRRVLEILISDMNLSCCVQERSRGSCVAFKIVTATVPPSVMSNTLTKKSQLQFLPGMLEIPKVSEDGYCPFVDRMAGRFNHVSLEGSAWNLHNKLKQYGLEQMLQQSKGGPLHAFSSFIVSYGMLQPVDGKPKAIYLLYGDEIGRRAGHPEYMMPTLLTRVIQKDSSHSSVTV